MVKFLCSFRTIKYPQISWCGIRVILHIAIDVEKKAPLSSESIFLSKASWFGPKNGAGYEESRGTGKTKKKKKNQYIEIQSNTDTSTRFWEINPPSPLPQTLWFFPRDSYRGLMF